MHVRIWGSRGSLATPGAETLRVGGNTTCVEVSANGSRVILDAGTGIRGLGLDLAGCGDRCIDICLTHLHLDHIEGLGFFAPFYDPDCEVNVWGPPSSVRTLQERISRYLSSPLFPVEVSDLPARVVFSDVPEETFEIGELRITAYPVSHPGTTLGYRVEHDGAALAFIPDHEPALGIELDSLTSDWISGFPVAEGATLLMHDAQYTEEEYPHRVGWGHSSVSQTVSFAAKTGAERLLLFHHDPGHTDDDLDAHCERACELWRGEGPMPELALEGMELEL
jgi:phosphoribosyl 1,2-cyclic phosphodiesterase